MKNITKTILNILGDVFIPAITAFAAGIMTIIIGIKNSNPFSLKFGVLCLCFGIVFVASIIKSYINSALDKDALSLSKTCNMFKTLIFLEVIIYIAVLMFILTFISIFVPLA